MVGDKSTLTKYVSCRVSEVCFDKFSDSAAAVGADQSTMMREFIDAFNEGRMKITPTEEQKKLNKQRGELYNVD